MREKSNYIIIYYVTIDQYYLGDTYELRYVQLSYIVVQP